MMVQYDHYAHAENDAWRWPHFTPEEMADTIDESLVIYSNFLDWLESVRVTFGQPMIVTSGYRTAAHQEKLSGRRKGAHVDGMAVDVHVYGESALKLVRIATGMGVFGLGIQQKGPHANRYIHLDRWVRAPDGQRPMIWSY